MQAIIQNTNYSSCGMLDCIANAGSCIWEGSVSILRIAGRALTCGYCCKQRAKEQDGQNVEVVVQQEEECILSNSPEERMRSVSFLWSTKLVPFIPDLSDLRVKEFVAEGIEGSVFTLEDVRTGEVSRVLKVADGVDNIVFPERGAHLASGIDHPGICSPTHIFYRTQKGILSLTRSLESRWVAMVMPYVEGDSLASKMGEIAERAERVFRFGLLLLEAVAELTRRGIEHGDLNKDNILVDQKLEPIIIDFNGARKVQAVSCGDYETVQWHLKELIIRSRAIKHTTKEFLVNHAIPLTQNKKISKGEYSFLPRRMIALMRACLDHLDAIKADSTVPFERDQLEKSVDGYLRGGDVLGEVACELHHVDRGIAS